MKTTALMRTLRHILTLLALVAVAFAQTQKSTDQPTANSFEQVKPGQTQEEVHATVGLPQRITPLSYPESTNGRFELWDTPSTVYTVHFDTGGKVVAVLHAPRAGLDFGDFIPYVRPHQCPMPTAAPLQTEAVPTHESAEHKHARQNLDQANKYHGELSAQIDALRVKVCQINNQIAQMSLPTPTAIIVQFSDLVFQVDALTALDDSNQANILVLESRVKYADSLAKERAAEEARASEERRKIRDACGLIYKNTADKKVGDVTVKEEQQVRACQALGLYPPQ